MTEIDNTVLFSIQEDLDRLVNDLDIHFDIGKVEFQDHEDYQRLHFLRTQLEKYVLEDFHSVRSRLFKLVYPLRDND